MSKVIILLAQYGVLLVKRHLVLHQKLLHQVPLHLLLLHLLLFSAQNLLSLLHHVQNKGWPLFSKKSILEMSLQVILFPPSFCFPVYLFYVDIRQLWSESLHV